MKAPASPTSEVFTSVSNVAPRRHQGGIVPGGAIISALNDVEAIDLNALGTQVGSEGVKGHRPALAPSRAGAFQLELEGVKAPKPLASSEEPTESISYTYLNARRHGNRQPGLHAVATAVVGDVVPGGAIISA